MIKKLFLGIASLLASLISVPSVLAHCPLCTGAVVAGAAGARYFGLDMTIVGLFAGAVGISAGLWLDRIIKKKYFKGQGAAIVIASFLLTIIPTMPFVPDELFLSLLGNGYFLNRMLFGSIIGGIITWLAFIASKRITKTRGNTLFPFQTIVLTLAALIIAAIPLYYLV